MGKGDDTHKEAGGNLPELDFFMLGVVSGGRQVVFEEDVPHDLAAVPRAELNGDLRVLFMQSFRQRGQVKISEGKNGIDPQGPPGESFQIP